MLACGSCGSTNAPGVAGCAKCGASLAGAGMAMARENANDEAVLRELAEKDRLKRRRIGHAITGAMTFFLINLLFGLPGSLHPAELLSNAIASSIFGAPIGYLISRTNAGPFKGALISAATFAVVLVILSLLSGRMPSALGLVVGALSGCIPGYIIGLHVESDN